MNPSKLAACIRIADEYRASLALRSYATDEAQATEQRLTWRAAFPDTWKSTLLGRAGQVVFVVAFLPFALAFIYLVAPIVEWKQGRNRKQAIVDLGRKISDDSTSDRFVDLYALWRVHGLSEPPLSFPIEVQAECLGRWIDVIYGGGMAAVMRVRDRVLQRRDQQSRAYAQMSLQGGHVSFIDPATAVARDLSGELHRFERAD